MCGSAAFARAMRNTSRGVGIARHRAVRVSIYSAPRTSLTKESEWFVVRRKRKERDARIAGQPAFSIACTVQFIAWAGLAVGFGQRSRVGWAQCTYRLG